ncbi:HPP family protein [Rheinheimera fenheensis]|uniref:HPP family protein n=1 Tax=Rheinheimera fenheensis TaxID=3152295 RepID=UPI0032613C25
MRKLLSVLHQRMLAQLGLVKRDSQRLSAIPLTERLKVVSAAFVALLLVTLISRYFAPTEQAIVLLASMGASSVLLFGLPNSPLAQPWSFAAGHLISAGIGLLCAHLFNDMALMAAVTIALVLFAMYLFECMHPPGGATALVPVIASAQQVPDYTFLLYPVALNVAVMLLVALFLQRYWLKLGRHSKAATMQPVKLRQDLSPLARLGLQADDLLAALNSFNTVVDIREQDLETLYHQAQLIAYQRKSGQICCADIMSRDLVTVSAATRVSDAWLLLRKHKLSMLPVVDSQQQLLGVITMVDFLSRVQVPHYWGVLRFLRQRLSGAARRDKNRTVADYMVKDVIVARSHDHIAALVPLLSDQGFHHIPVLDGQQKLVGIVSQSDLIAALFNAQLT